MKKYRFTAVVERDEDGMYIGIVPDLKGQPEEPNKSHESQERANKS